MNVTKQDFKVAISEWVEFEIPEMVERDVKIPLKTRHIPAVVGPRRSGKTWLMFSAMENLMKGGVPENRIYYINFEHERLAGAEAKDMEKMVEAIYELFNPKGKLFLFLDEIQNVREWYKWARKAHDMNKYKMFLSGSSSRLLSRELSTSLRGRSIDIPLLPFSFREFMRAKGIDRIDEVTYVTSSRGKLLNHASEYLKFGGFPEVVSEESTPMKKSILRNYYSTIFHRDLAERFGIRNETALDLFLKLMITSYSKYLSISRTYNWLKSSGMDVGKQTIADFMKHASDVFFILPIGIYARSEKTRARHPRKVYLSDTGFVEALYPEKSSKGRLMENAVAVDLARRSGMFSNFTVSYWRDGTTDNAQEVDFVVSSGLKVQELIQVSYAESRDEIREGEISSLLKASSLLRCRNLTVVTWDYEGIEKIGTREIKFVPLWKWLYG